MTCKRSTNARKQLSGSDLSTNISARWSNFRAGLSTLNMLHLIWRENHPTLMLFLACSASLLLIGWFCRADKSSLQIKPHAARGFATPFAFCAEGVDGCAAATFRYLIWDKLEVCTRFLYSVSYCHTQFTIVFWCKIVFMWPLLCFGQRDR